MSSMESASNLEMILKRDRWFVLAGLAGVTALAWAYLVVMATDMDDMALGAIAMPTVEPWSALDFWLMFVMWAVMMVGMMLPSAAPMILLYAAATLSHPSRFTASTRAWPARSRFASSISTGALKPKVSIERARSQICAAGWRRA